MPGCEGALIVTSNLYKGLLIATPTPVEGGHQVRYMYLRRAKRESQRREVDLGDRVQQRHIQCIVTST